MEAYYVIDGQQRLTTSIILINVLLNALASEQLIMYKNKTHWENLFLFEDFNDFKSYRFGYIKDMPSYEFFKTVILGQESLQAANVANNTLYTRNLAFAKSYFEKKIDNWSSEEIQNTFQCLVSVFKFNFYEISTDLDVFVAFETMNNRGKPLSQLELLKNRLIYLSTLLNDGTSNQLRTSINAAWCTVYEFLGKESNRELVDDDFLRDHWIMYFPEYNRDEARAYSQFLLGEHFTTKKLDSKDLTSKNIKDYVQSIQVSVKYWYQMFNPRSMDDQYSKSQTQLVRLNHQRFTAFQPLIIAAIAKSPLDEELAQLLKNIERFVFLVFQISRRRTGTKNSHFFKLANQCFSGEYKLAKLITEIETMTSEWLSVPNFKLEIAELFSKDIKGYYGWSGIRYFLFEYESSLIPSNNGNTKVPWEDYISRTLDESIEHIYPQDPVTEEWPEFNKFTESQANKLRHSLGNLLILSVSSNASASRRSYSKKCSRLNPKGEAVGYTNGSYSEIKVSQDYPKWTPHAILERGLQLLDFLERNWGVSFGNEESKSELLGLSFLYSHWENE